MTEQQFNSIVEWQKKTFLNASTYSKIKHLEEKIQELLFEVTIDNKEKQKDKEHEFADCFMLLFGAAACEGLSYNDICNAIDEKMTINKARKWGTPDSNGVVKHIK